MIKAAYSDKGFITDILVDSFYDNSSVNYIIRQDEKKERRIRSLMNYSFYVCYYFREVFYSEDRKGCALVLFPGVSRHSWGIRLQLAGIYIKDKNKSKKSACQEKEIIPRFVAGNTRVVSGYSVSCLVVAMPGFTLPDSRYLAIDLHEKEGGRNLLLKVGNRHLVRAVPLSDLQ